MSISPTNPALNQVDLRDLSPRSKSLADEGIWAVAEEILNELGLLQANEGSADAQDIFNQLEPDFHELKCLLSLHKLNQAAEIGQIQTLAALQLERNHYLSILRSVEKLLSSGKLDLSQTEEDELFQTIYSESYNFHLTETLEK
ncbi:hypothetical protein PCE1_004339 [Barthelona sp. PCE]